MMYDFGLIFSEWYVIVEFLPMYRLGIIYPE